jgi:hypothetical protein
VRLSETTPTRASAATLATRKRDLGRKKIGHLDRLKLIEYGCKRADQRAGPVALGIDIGVMTMILTHAAAVHGLEIPGEGVDLARVALKRLGLIGKGRVVPCNPTSVGTAFRRAWVDPDVTDLHFRDLRHDGTSRLFEVGPSIEQVALVTGPRGWKRLRRSTRIRPEGPYRLGVARTPLLGERPGVERPQASNPVSGLCHGLPLPGCPDPPAGLASVPG